MLGSDHCPVWANVKILLSHADSCRTPPPLCTYHRPGFRLEQCSISKFLSAANLLSTDDAKPYFDLSVPLRDHHTNKKRKKLAGESKKNTVKRTKIMQTQLFNRHELTLKKCDINNNKWSCESCTFINLSEANRYNSLYYRILNVGKTLL